LVDSEGIDVYFSDFGVSFGEEGLKTLYWRVNHAGVGFERLYLVKGGDDVG
jgi:hypothetical protein